MESQVRHLCLLFTAPSSVAYPPPSMAMSALACRCSFICRLLALNLSSFSLLVRGGYAKIYLKFTILKNYMHRARAARARALAPHAKVGAMSQL